MDGDGGARNTLALRARWQALLTATPDLLFWLSREGVYLDWHIARPELFAAESAILVGRTIEEVLEPDAARACRAALERAFEFGGVETVEYDLELPVGRRSFEARLFAVGDEVTVVVRDATTEVGSRRALVDQAIFLEAILTGAFDMAIVVDARGSVTYANRSVHDLLGHNVADVIGTSLFDWVHPDDLGSAAEAFSGVIEQPGAAGPRELRIRDAHGDWRTCETVANNLLHEPAVKGVVFHGRDITRRRDAATLFRGAFDLHPSPSVVVRADGLLIANVAFARLLGRTVTELEAISWADVADIGPVEPGRHEHVGLVCRDGTELLVDLSCQRVRGSSDNDDAAALIVIEHTYGHRVDDSVIALADAIDFSPDFIAFIGASGFWTANRAAVEQLGYPKGHQAEVLELVHPADRLGVTAMFDRVLRGDWDPRFTVAVRLLTADGETRDYECRARRVAHLAGALIIARDVTGSVRRPDLAPPIAPDDRVAAVAQLAVGAAHDFSNLLGVAANYLHVLERSDLDDAQGADVAAARRAVAEAGGLVNRLLAIGRRSDPAAACEVGDVIATHRDLIASSLPAELDLRFDDPSKSVFVPVEEQDLLQVLMNLVANAADADATAIDVTYGVGTDGAPWITVADTGSGMDAATVAASRTPFFTTKARGVGTGLGLSLVEGVLNGSRGVLDIRSQPGEGTVIDLRWPVAAPDPEELRLG